MLGSGIVNKQRQIKKELKDGYRFDQWFTPAKVQSMLNWDELCDSAIVAASLSAGFVRLDAVIYWANGKFHLGYDLMVKDSPFSREWICYESLPDEVRYNAWNLEREMFQVLDRAVEQFDLSYTECRFPVINPNHPKPKDAAREARVASVSDASRKVEAQHP